MRCKVRLKDGDYFCNTCRCANIRKNLKGINQPFCCKNKIFLVYKDGYFTNILNA